MPQPEAVNRAPDALIRAYERAWSRITAEQEALLSDPRRAPRRARLTELRRRVELELSRLEVDTRTWLQEQFPKVYAQGMADTAALVGDSASWTAINREAMEQLALDTFDDVLKATRNVRRDTKRFIREAAKIHAELTTSAGRTAVQSGRNLKDVLARRGITSVVYRDGSRHGLDEYTQMLLRTKTATAYNLGGLNQAPEVTWWECFDGPDCGWSFHESTDLANGKIVTRDESLGYPISHPNCRRSFGPRPDLQTLPREAAQSADPSQTLQQVMDQRLADEARTGLPGRQQLRTPDGRTITTQELESARFPRTPREPRRPRTAR